MPKKRADRTLPKGLHEKPPGSGNFYSTFYNKTRRPKLKWVTLGTMTREAAEIEHKRLRTLYSLGEYDPWEPKPTADEPASDPLVSEAVESFLEARSGLAPNTLRNKHYNLHLFVRYLSRRRRIRSLTRADVVRFLDRPNLKESSRVQVGWILSSFFEWCQEEGFCDTNPAREYLSARNKNLSAYERRRSQTSVARGAVMPDDLRRILSALQLSGHHSHLYDVFLFAVATGVRRHELCHLCRRDVYLDAPPIGASGLPLPWPVTGRLHIRNWDNPRTGEHFRTKTGKDRLVPFTPLAARIAARHLAAYETEDDFAPLFRAIKGGRMRKDQLSRDFKQYREAVGLPDTLTFHSLRHAHASYLLMLGANVLTIKRVLGHSTLAELDTYAELAESFLMGDARPLQRQILLLLCPDLPDAMLERVLPSRRSLLGVLSGQRGSRAQHLQALIPAEDALYSGLLYEISEESATISF